MTSSEFVALVSELKALGALHVRAGDFEVTLNPTEAAQTLDWDALIQDEKEGEAVPAQPGQMTPQMLRDHYLSAIPRR